MSTPTKAVNHRVGRFRVSTALGPHDPRLRRNANAQVRSDDLEEPFFTNARGRLDIGLKGAIRKAPVGGELQIVLGEGLEETPGSPVAVRVKSASKQIGVSRQGLLFRPQSGDYAARQIKNDTSLAGASLADVLSGVSGSVAPSPVAALAVNGSSGAFARADHVHTLTDGVVTYAKIQDVSATDKLLGRSAAGSGDVEEIACTAAGRALIDDASADAQITTLGGGAPTGTGVLVRTSSPTIVTPTIASLTNAQHNHQNAAGGGSLDGSAIGSGTVAVARLPAASTSASAVAELATDGENAADVVVQGNDSRVNRRLFMSRGATCTGSGFQVLFTYQIPAGLLGTGYGIRASAQIRRSTGLADITATWRLGGTDLGTPAAASAANQRLDCTVWNTGASNTQRSELILMTTTLARTVATAAIDTSVAVNLTLEIDFATDANICTLELVEGWLVGA